MNTTSRRGPARPRRWKVLTVAAVFALLVASYTFHAVTSSGRSAPPDPVRDAASDRVQVTPGAEASPHTPPGASTLASGPAATPEASATPVTGPGRTRTPLAESGDTVVANGWPAPRTTGWRHTGVTLKPYGGSVQEIVITKNGTMIDGADIRARVRILANNVTIKRSRIMATTCDNAQGCFVLSLEKGYYGLLVEDVEVTRAPGAHNMDRAIAVGEGGGTRTHKRAIIRRAHVHGTYRGILVGNHTVIENSYIGDLDDNPPPGAHTAAISAHGGQDVVIRRNTVALAPSEGNSANLSLYGDSAPLEDLLVEGNLFNGGTACLWFTTDFNRGAGTFVTIRNNAFGVTYFANCGRYEPVHIAPLDAGGSNFTWSNNVWHAPGDPKHGRQVQNS